MHTKLADFIAGTAAGDTAAGILGKCVHCGFCNAVCPTYQLLGDELDGPRGRIYQIKEMLEGGAAAPSTLAHLDACLTCRACETACPSGVEYGRLLEIGREVAEQRIGRGAPPRLQRWLLRRLMPFPRRFGAVLRLGQGLRGLMPARLRAQLPAPAAKPGAWPESGHARRMVVLEGCVQPALAPSINAAAARVLDRLGISLLRAPGAGCCGALSLHLSASEEARGFMRRNIDAWLPMLDEGVEAIVMTASGCGVTVRDYAALLQQDPAYASKAVRVADAVRDIAEVIGVEDLRALLATQPEPRRLAFHSPCTLQHGQCITGVVEELLRVAGCELTPVADAQLCCGSAGTYSLLQPELSAQLGDAKARALEQGAPACIATANLGCLLQIRSRTQTPVRHWVEILDEALS